MNDNCVRKYDYLRSCLHAYENYTSNSSNFSVTNKYEVRMKINKHIRHCILMLPRSSALKGRCTCTIMPIIIQVF